MSDGPQSQDRESAGRGDDNTATPPAHVRPPGLEDIEEYRLIELIGEGGMGEVYKAEQRGAIRRLVALKVIRLGLDTKTVIARFDAERQALALMNHPNIAKVFDGGSTKQGRPYFVMEYVAGEPITHYCDRRRLPIRARLDLFAQVCDAVQHAHTKGIIHRDLKASNVLVTEQDGKPTPKVIDFGVAKAINQRLTEQTLFTETGRLVGTPASSSPEQAEGSVDVDTRSDVYSLGVMLYELLTGALPFDPTKLRALAYGEMQRLIREVDPPRPSTFYSKPSEASLEAAQRRAATVEELASTLRNELEWIPLRAMRKERGERYQTASDLARDIQAYLDGRPLIAAPDSRLYRWRKTLRRNRGLASAVAAVVLVLLLGIVMTSWQAWRAQRQKGFAEQNAAEAQKRLAHATASARLLDEIFRGILPDTVKGKNTELLIEILRRTEPKLEEILTEPSWRAYHLVLLGEAYRLLGDYDHATEVLKRARELAQVSYDQAVAAGRFEDDFKEVRTLLDALEKYGHVHLDLADDASAERLWREALELAQRHLPPDDPALAHRLSDLGMVLAQQENLAEAVPLIEEAQKRVNANPGGFSTEDHAQFALVMAFLAFQRSDNGKANAELDRAEQLLIQAQKTEGSSYAMLLSMRGTLTYYDNAHPNAVQQLTKAIDLRHRLAPNIDARQQALDLKHRGHIRVNQSQPGPAADDYWEAVRIGQELLRDTSLTSLKTRAELAMRAAWGFHETQRLEESRQAAALAMDLWALAIERASSPGQDRPAATQPTDISNFVKLRLQVTQRWAQVSIELGDAQAALPIIRDCLTRQQEVYQGDKSADALKWIAISQWTLAEAILASSPQEAQRKEALSLLLNARRSLVGINAKMDRTVGGRPSPREGVLVRLISLYEQEGDAAAAQRYRDELGPVRGSSQPPPGGIGGSGIGSGGTMN